MNNVTFKPELIVFNSYPFPGASVFPHGAVPYTSIRDVDPTATPPEIRLNTGETLFISATYNDDFAAVIIKHNLKVCQRVDLWALLLEPFLDTSFTQEQKEQTLRVLENFNVGREEAKKIRKCVATKMYAYNSIHWDWVHLGLADLLEASLPIKPFIRYRLFNSRFIKLYKYAMSIAERGRASD